MRNTHPGPGVPRSARWCGLFRISLFQQEGAGLQFSEQLKLLRLKAGKSRYRLAQYSGLNEAYLLRLESGERTYRLSRMEPTEDGLFVKLSYLFRM